MPPFLTSNNFPNGATDHTEFKGQCFVTFTGGGTLSDISYFGLGQFGMPVPLAAWLTFGMQPRTVTVAPDFYRPLIAMPAAYPPAFRRHIGIVISSRAKPEMPKADEGDTIDFVRSFGSVISGARRVIAGVKRREPWGDWLTQSLFKCKTRCQGGFPIRAAGGEPTIAFWPARPGPGPTAIRSGGPVNIAVMTFVVAKKWLVGALGLEVERCGAMGASDVAKQRILIGHRECPLSVSSPGLFPQVRGFSRTGFYHFSRLSNRGGGVH